MEQDVWSPIAIKANSIMEARVGPLRLYVRSQGEELHIAWIHNEEVDAGPMVFAVGFVERAPAGLDWIRWVVGTDAENIELRPITPDRPAVVRPEVAVKVPTGREAFFFVRIPLWVQVIVSGKESLVLSTVPSVILSNTWFGDPLGGDLCYSLRTTARREAEEHSVAPHRAVVPVRVRNEAEAELDVTRICLAVKHLNIYRGPHCFWTNQVNATFRGEEMTSRLEFEKSAPSMAGDAALVSPMREPVPESLFRRTFISPLMNMRVL